MGYYYSLFAHWRRSDNEWLPWPYPIEESAPRQRATFKFHSRSWIRWAERLQKPNSSQVGQVALYLRETLTHFGSYSQASTTLLYNLLNPSGKIAVPHTQAQAILELRRQSTLRYYERKSGAKSFRAFKCHAYFRISGVPHLIWRVIFQLQLVARRRREGKPELDTHDENCTAGR